MMSGRPVNLAVWGLGRHAFKNVLPALKDSSNAKLIGVYTRNRDSAQTACEQNNCRAWPDPQTMLRDAEVDAVYVATPIGLHHEHSLMVLRSRKHLICEKSLTQSYETSLELIDLARQNDLVLCESFMYLYHPQLLQLAKLVRAPAFGRITSLTCNFSLPPLENPGYRHNPDLGGGAFLDVACYPVSIVLALSPLADIPVVKYAQIQTEKGFAVDTVGTALLQLESGAHAYLTWGYNRPYKNEIGILGEFQSAYLNSVFTKRPDQSARLFVCDQFGTADQVEIEPANSFVGMLSYFQQAVYDSAKRVELLRQAERQAELMQQIRNHPQT